MRWKKRCTGELQESNERLQQINSQLQRTLKEIRRLNEMSDRLQACYTREQAYAIVSLYMEQLFPHLEGGICHQRIEKLSRRDVELGGGKFHPKTFPPR
ncbi:hypothetical protein [Lyngbya sp. CCY1209]|uniref:hypothetical protein n=1 Tax=Lyngbya sp. CCY1209 TaxID=2886103 RepID=UPI002D20DA3C|nr:hypothetical protein [Lyngbya sp. CCY1209]MEB3883250.1 hypothetical protein [Lyngbya sp. CCY1209]